MYLVRGERFFIKNIKKDKSDLVISIPVSPALNDGISFTELIKIKPDSDARTLSLFDSFSLNIVKKGEGKHILGSKETSFREKDIFLLSPFTLYSSVFGNAEIIRIYFRPDVLHVHLFSKIMFSKELSARLTSQEFEEMLTISEKIYLEDGKKWRFSTEMNLSLTSCAAALFLRKCETDLPDIKDITSPLLRSMLSFISENYRKDISLSDISKKLSVTEGRLSEIFSEGIGTVYSEFIKKLRLDLSKDLLLSSELTSREIANICGFSSPSYYSGAFRDAFGMSPLTYKRLYQKEEYV